MKRESFEFIARMIRRRAGIALGDDKLYLVENRLTPHLGRLGVASLDDLARALRSATDDTLADEVVDAMMTAESWFFRDYKPFDVLRKAVLPGLAALRRKAGVNRLRIWSIGCAAGQEPYSIAMIAEEDAEKLGVEVEIVATDISAAAIAKAKAGTYTTFEVQRGLPVRFLLKYFHQDGSSWTLDPAVRSRVELRRHNLLDSLRTMGIFDIVLCRNVVSAFDPEQRRDMLPRIAAQMTDDAILFLGDGEGWRLSSDAFRALPGGTIFARAPREVAAQPGARLPRRHAG